jgi:hypothetical protein
VTSQKEPESESLRINRAALQLNTKLLSLVMGIMLALIIFVATLWLIAMGGHVDEQGEVIIGPHLALLGKFFIGYKVTVLGSFVGAFYGLAVGTIIGTIIGKIYNKLTTLRSPPGRDDDSES